MTEFAPPVTRVTDPDTPFNEHEARAHAFRLEKCGFLAYRSGTVVRFPFDWKLYRTFNELPHKAQYALYRSWPNFYPRTEKPVQG